MGFTVLLGRGSVTLARMPEPRRRTPSAVDRRSAADTNSRQRGIRKWRLQEALLDLLQRGRSLDDVTTAQIADKVGMDRSTVYHYTASKSELFRGALEMHLDAHFGRVDLDIGAEEPFRDWVARILDDIVRLWLTSTPLMLTSAYLADKETEHFVWVTERTRPWREAMERASRTAAARGEIALPADAAGAAEIAMATVQGVCAARLGHLELYPEPQQRAAVEQVRLALIDAVSRILGAAR